MILISAGLVLAAVVLLIAGFVLAKPFLIMWSIVVSVLSALFLVIGALLRRHELFPGGGQAAEPATPPPPAGLVPPSGTPYPQTGPMAGQLSPRPHPYQRTAPVPSPVPSPAPGVPTPHRPAAGGISPDAIVLVIPGRKRYHVQGCRQLAGRDHEELTYEEAREEGFTPCTACLPDAALGGRQLPPVDDAEPARSRAEASEPTRDLRPPVVQPKPAAKASTPASEPDASPAEAGWFGRTSQPEGPSAPAPREGASGGQGDPHPKTSGSGTTSGDQPGPSESRSSDQAGPSREGRPASGSPSPRERPPTGGSTPDPVRSPKSSPSGDAQRSSRDQDPARSPADSGSASGRAAQGDQESAGPAGEPSGSGTARGQRPDRSSPEPGRPQSPPRSSREAESAPDARGSGRSAQESGRSPQPQGSARPSREQGKPPYGSSLEADEPDSGPDTRPQPRVTAAGTPVPQPSTSEDRGSTGGDRPGHGTGTASTREDQPTPSDGRPTPRAGGGSPAQSGGERPAPARGKPGESGARGAGSEGSKAGGSGAREGGSGTREGESGSRAPKESRVTSPGDESEGSAEKTVRTRSLFEPASPPPRSAAGGAGPVRRPASSAESAKAQGPLPKGASRDTSGAKAEDGESTSGRTGEDDEKVREPAQRSATVKVIVGTRRYHGGDCPLIKGAGDSGVETMTRSQAEAAGLTACSVCQHDRETVS